MIIHKSHSKLELVKIILELNIKIKNPRQYKKINLSALLIDQLDTIDNIKASIHLPFNNIIDLKHYLINVNPNKILTIKEKNDIIHKCKQIKHYCRNGFNINISEYKDDEELMKDIQLVKRHGSIPSCRKAIKEYNMNPVKDDIDIYIPPHILKELEIKNRLKERKGQRLEHRMGKFIIGFD